MDDLSIVIPARWECEGIKQVIEDAKVHQPKEILVVIDSEDDPTIDHVLKPARVVFNHQGGFASAVVEGIRHARGKYTVFLMGDGCDRASDIGLFVAKARFHESKGIPVGIVGGHRKELRKQKVLKGLSSRLMNLAFSFKLPMKDTTNAFKLYDTGLLKEIVGEGIESDHFEVIPELCIRAHRKGVRIIEMPTVWEKKTAGEETRFKWAWALRYGRWLFK